MARPMKRGRYIGIILGATTAQHCYTLKIGGITFVVISTAIRSRLNDGLGSQFKKDTSKLERNIEPQERVKWRIKILMEAFRKTDKVIHQGVAEIILKKIVEESNQLDHIDNDIKRFILSDSSLEIIDKELDTFEFLCDDNNEKLIVDILFSFLVPLHKFFKAEKDNSTGKRLNFLIWR